MADKPTLPRLLLTRPAEGSDRFLDALDARGVPIAGAVVSPAVDIVSVGDIVQVPDGAAAVFTSRHAVSRTRADVGTRAYCLGEATAEEAQRLGYSPRVAGGTAEDLLQLLLADRPLNALVYCHGTHVRRDIGTPLRQAGVTLTAHVVYDQPELAPNEAARAVLGGREPIILPLFSPRTAQIVKGWTQDRCADDIVIALSNAVAEAWQTDARVAVEPSMSAMVDEVAAICSSQGKG
ncbi:MAG: uroporphyrinogen-III synthase [Pseudomonadota bacterium]